MNTQLDFDYSGLGLSPKCPVLVGVVNVTPDSFSDGGRLVDPHTSLEYCDTLLRSGAALLDIGAEATSPGSTPLSASEELQRLRPLLELLGPMISCCSIDTYKSTVARFALAAGCRIINDVSALRAEPQLAEVVAEFDAYLVLMYAKDAPLPHVTPETREYDDVVGHIADFLCERVEQAVRRGVSPARIIVDPGMGRFVSNDPRYSFELLRDLPRFRAAGLSQPIMIGASRKGFLGGALGERDPISQLAGLSAYLNGASFIRTHNVAMARSFFEFWERTQGASIEFGMR